MCMHLPKSQTHTHGEKLQTLGWRDDCANYIMAVRTPWPGSNIYLLLTGPERFPRTGSHGCGGRKQPMLQGTVSYKTLGNMLRKYYARNGTSLPTLDSGWSPSMFQTYKDSSEVITENQHLSQVLTTWTTGLSKQPPPALPWAEVISPHFWTIGSHKNNEIVTEPWPLVLQRMISFQTSQGF